MACGAQRFYKFARSRLEDPSAGVPPLDSDLAAIVDPPMWREAGVRKAVGEFAEAFPLKPNEKVNGDEWG